MAPCSAPRSSPVHHLCVRILLASLLAARWLVPPCSASSSFRVPWAKVAGRHDYRDALAKSILFFEGQRSGRLPPGQRATWRGDSGVSDGAAAGVDLEGGYYDAGDNVKFGFPMAFTTTMLAWSVVEFGDSMPRDERRHATAAVRWATDYLLKTVAHPGVIFLQVGDPWKDHGCWERPEDMDMDRTVYNVSAGRPGSEIAGETAAALAAASMVFRDADPEYAETLLTSARKAFEFADTYKGAYSDDPDLRAGGCPFYCDFNGYQDELLWGAAWLRRASKDDTFLQYIQNNGKTLGAEDSSNEFGWDNKHAGLNVLVSKVTDCFHPSPIQGVCRQLHMHAHSRVVFTAYHVHPRRHDLQAWRQQHAACHLHLFPAPNLRQVPLQILSYCQLWRRFSWPSNSSAASQKTGTVTSDTFHHTYIPGLLTSSPMKLTDCHLNISKCIHMYPQRIHHRASSLPSIKDHPQQMACKEGTPYFNSSSANPNPLIGAVVGGPGEDDAYEDDRADFRKSEPTTYINAPLVGVLAYFVGNPNPGHTRH